MLQGERVSTTMKATLMVVIFHPVTSNAIKVNWAVQNETLIIGKGVELWCNTSSMDGKCKGCPLIWTGGYDNKILSFNGVSRDDRKYTVPPCDKGNHLFINDLNVDDLRYNYTCSYGFEKYTDNLMSRRTYLFLPNNDTVSVDLEVKMHTIVGEIILKEVHPIPECILHLNNKNFTSVLGKKIIRMDIFSHVEYNFTFDISPRMCDGRLQIDCIFGQVKTTVEKRTINFPCNDDRQRSANYIELHVTGGILVSCLLLVITGFLVMVFIKRNPNLPGCSSAWCYNKCQRNIPTKVVTSNDDVIEIERTSRNNKAASSSVRYVDIHTVTTKTSTKGKIKRYEPVLSYSLCAEQEPFLWTDSKAGVSEENRSIKHNGPETTSKKYQIAKNAFSDTRVFRDKCALTFPIGT